MVPKISIVCAVVVSVAFCIHAAIVLQDKVFERTILSNDEVAPQTMFPGLTLENETKLIFTTTNIFKGVNGKHRPDFFTNQVSMEVLLLRGSLIDSRSACEMAAWVYFSEISLKGGDDCTVNGKFRPRYLWNTSSLAENDTLYVALPLVNSFVTETLASIQVRVVVITGQWHNYDRNAIDSDAFQNLVNSEVLIHWFVQNMATYAPDPYHPNVSPWPYGLHPSKKRYLKGHFLTSKDNPPINKDQMLFVSKLYKPRNSSRAAIPSSKETLDPFLYYMQMARSHYVLSPNGDRPECYRHYEALGVGTVPITELDPLLYRHLKDGPVIFNNVDWNLTRMEESLPRPPLSVNPRQVYEEFWMEYAEGVVGRPLRWLDKLHRIPALLEDLAKHFQ